MDRDKFINEYAEKILKNKAIVFLGSGINKEVGLPDWDELLTDFFEELDLKDINNEINVDNLDIAQFYLDKKDRKSLHELLRKKLRAGEKTEEGGTLKAGENLCEVAKLPVRDFWTTNYDNLLESALDDIDVKYNKIVSKNDFALINAARTNIYKMHGDIDNVESIVLTRTDYDEYQTKRLMFWEKFSIELCNKSCVFIGTSLNDYNLNLILGRIPKLIDLDESAEHYIFVKKSGNDLHTRYDDYRSNYLEKYFKIKTIFITEWNELKEIFAEVNAKVRKKNIFISGAFEKVEFEYKELQNEEAARQFVIDLSYELIANDFKIINGFGLGVGPAVLEGAMTRIYEDKLVPSEFLEMVPFPYATKDKDRRERIYLENRKNMLEKAGQVIFLFGNKYDKDKNIINSSGMLEEYKVAKDLNKKLHPICATGYCSEEIFGLENKNSSECSKTTLDISGIIELLK
jgi:NAD-dependent SIR2 family protein deacetylase